MEEEEAREINAERRGEKVEGKRLKAKESVRTRAERKRKKV